ncbi:3-dehydroquinate synthase [Patescibacteria group bacterium]|nr:3-dehydroquinate synthase [Patescibacteria group bacterium]
MQNVKIAKANLKNLKNLIKDRRHAIIVDANLDFKLKNAIPYKASEQNKDLKSIIWLTKELQERKLDRHSVLVAIGGGNTSDLVGFLASIYMRGIPWICVPSTLLAMADSSIGGKTSANFDNFKNILGSFHLPETVLIDIELLKTLPLSDFQSGMAEIIKIALILDKKFVKFLEQNSENIMKRDVKTLEQMILWAIKLKNQIVSDDLKEKNKRKLLNFGHTFGHAIESKENYHIPHGHAIAMGMILMNEYSKTSEETKSRTISLLKLYGLPTASKHTHTSLKKYFKSDKKRKGDSIDVVILPEIGKAKTFRDKNFLK